ncbi:response regulator [Haliovirga abyssi]|uniref:Chemotaxis protein CheY n=1 Tax=Haliovirga abyssi TaxID=2996794 RepID=A0AAU9D4N0_9FUSO|nr:response regulator [Haliovirga abyssi]BDU49503.1 chemotaxis protein CheY [Haliovirga abyssi]
MGNKVLIVDDMLFMRVTLKKMLEEVGFEVVAEAENGEDGIAKYKKFLPDIVTLDITMPEMNGIEALEEIKKINPDVKVVMISAMGQQPNVIKAVKLGAKGFIVKPFKIEKIKEAMLPLMEK